MDDNDYNLIILNKLQREIIILLLLKKIKRNSNT